MFDQYLITGATGFLSRAVAESWCAAERKCMRLYCIMTPISILLPKKSIPSSVMCA